MNLFMTNKFSKKLGHWIRLQLYSLSCFQTFVLFLTILCDAFFQLHSIQFAAPNAKDYFSPRQGGGWFRHPSLAKKNPQPYKTDISFYEYGLPTSKPCQTNYAILLEENMKKKKKNTLWFFLALTWKGTTHWTLNISICLCLDKSCASMLTHSTFLYIKFQPTLNTGKLRYVHLIFMRINKHTTDPFEINGKYANLEKGRRKK